MKEEEIIRDNSFGITSFSVAFAFERDGGFNRKTFANIISLDIHSFTSCGSSFF